MSSSVPDSVAISKGQRKRMAAAMFNLAKQNRFSIACPKCGEKFEAGQDDGEYVKRGRKFRCPACSVPITLIRQVKA